MTKFAKWLILIIWVLSPISVDAKTPIDYVKWQIDDTTFSTNIGGAIHNYKKDANWAAIDNSYVNEGDSIVKVETAVLKTRVNKKTGKVSITVTHEGQTFSISQRLIGVGWLKMSTGDHLWIDNTMNWNNDSRDSTYIHWDNISPGVNYGVRKDLGSVEHGIIFKPAFLDSAVVLYNQRIDTLDLALANVIEYTLSGNVNNADSALGRISKREFKNIGRRVFELTEQRVYVADQVWTVDNLEPEIKVEQFWKRIGNKMYCVEFVPMHEIKKLHEDYPTKNLWHNATADITADDIEMGGGLSRTAAHNQCYGSATTIEIWTVGPRWIIWRANGLAAALGAGATITAGYYRWKVTTNFSSGTATFYQVLKPWIEGVTNADGPGGGEGHTGSMWDNNASFGWNGFGASCANDDGVDNSTDGDGATCTTASERDQLATAAGTATSVSTTEDSVSLSTTMLQNWYDLTDDENGCIVIPSASLDQNWGTDDNGTASNKPHLHLQYTVSGAADYPLRRRRIGYKIERFDDEKYSYSSYSADPNIGR